MKAQRQKLIMSIIGSEDIETQEQLIARLNENGFRATQATISRDIKDLRLTKELTPGGKYRYTVFEKVLDSNSAGKLSAIFKEAVQSVDCSGNIVVIKTLPGLAQAASSAMDSMHMASIVGCVGGDDTAFVLMRTERDAMELKNELEGMF
ncbi:MAG: arginine repressor [Clostridiales bacterium]|jgi:transcriptional regulator of arginine metabolism|nr:arginine repressor [Clostridiales bacterium]